MKAAAQHSSSELGSAFALHFSCSVNEGERGLTVIFESLEQYN